MRPGAWVFVGILIALWAANASCLARAPTTGPKLMAHRGVHQTFPPDGLTATTCTAALIRPPTHRLIENTLPAMQAAFDAGASAVELDVHATADGHLAVFHDATLDCRTDGVGPPEHHPLATLRGLDLGYGYTADGGATFPLRGSGVGMLVTLPEVFAAFPGRRFVIHIKSGRPEDGERVAEVLRTLSSSDRAQQIVYGGDAAERVAARLPEVTVFTTDRVKACLKGYLAVGWLGFVPEACRDTWVLVPSNYAWLLWGYPRRFEERMFKVGSEVVLAGPLLDGVSTGIDDLDQLGAVPEGFGGWIWSNRVEVLGPSLAGG